MSQLNVKSLEFLRSESLLVELDLNLTPELESEGYAREVSRKVQAFRKKLGLNKEDKIKLSLVLEDDLKQILSSQHSLLKDRTGSLSLEILDEDNNSTENVEDFVVKNKKGKLLIKSD